MPFCTLSLYCSIYRSFTALDSFSLAKTKILSSTNVFESTTISSSIHRLSSDVPLNRQSIYRLSTHVGCFLSLNCSEGRYSLSKWTWFSIRKVIGIRAGTDAAVIKVLIIHVAGSIVGTKSVPCTRHMRNWCEPIVVGRVKT